MKFNFEKACAAMLIELGGVKIEWHRPQFEINTTAGRLTVTPYEDWVACKFDDTKLAVKTIFFGCLNPFSGKWNWHFNKPGADAVAALKANLTSIIQKEVL